VVITDLEANGAAFEGGAVAFLSGALDTQSAQVREAAAIGLLDPPCCLLRRNLHRAVSRPAAQHSPVRLPAP
jgi:hypothetical protein